MENIKTTFEAFYSMYNCIKKENDYNDDVKKKQFNQIISKFEKEFENIPFDLSNDNTRTDLDFKVFIVSYLIYSVKKDFKIFKKNFVSNTVINLKNEKERDEYISSFLQKKHSKEFIEVFKIFFLNKYSGVSDNIINHNQFDTSIKKLEEKYDKLEKYIYIKIIQNIYQKSLDK